MLLFQVAGAALLLVAYVGLQLGWVGERSDLYLGANIAGAATLAACAAATAQWGFAVLNAVWWIVALRTALTR